jgi:hypothetical protein
MRRLMLSLAAVSVVGAFFATPAASAQQSVNFFVGGFVPKALDSRGDINNGVSNDVLVNNKNFLIFSFDRFDGVTFGGEYLVGLGDFFDAGASIGFYQQSVPAADANFFNSNGSNIVADLKLRIVPITATFRVLPLGHRAPVVPYVGVGVGINYWRYSESGQFVDYTPPVGRNPPIFNATFLGNGWATGPVVLGGVKVPIGPFAPGFEVRYQGAKGDLPSNQSFSGTKVDLGGMNYLFTFDIRF